MSKNSVITEQYLAANGWKCEGGEWHYRGSCSFSIARTAVEWEMCNAHLPIETRAELEELVDLFNDRMEDFD